MDMAPRRALGAISPIYRGCAQIAIPVIQMRCQLWDHKQMLIMLSNLFNSISFSFMFSHLTDRLHAIYHKDNSKSLTEFQNMQWMHFNHLHLFWDCFVSGRPKAFSLLWDILFIQKKIFWQNFIFMNANLLIKKLFMILWSKAMLYIDNIRNSMNKKIY